MDRETDRHRLKDTNKNAGRNLANRQQDLLTDIFKETDANIQK